MLILGMLSAADDGGTRILLLGLLLVAVALLFVGVTIALFTLHNQRKGQDAHSGAKRLESENV